MDVKTPIEIAAEQLGMGRGESDFRFGVPTLEGQLALKTHIRAIHHWLRKGNAERAGHSACRAAHIVHGMWRYGIEVGVSTSEPSSFSAAAWRELDAMPVPKTTFYDTNGLPAYTVLGDGTRVYPSRSTFGERRIVEDPGAVGKDLRAELVEIEVIWSGSVPDDVRSPTLRSAEQEREIERGYDEAAVSIYTQGTNGRPSWWKKEEAPQRARRDVAGKAQADRSEGERKVA